MKLLVGNFLNSPLPLCLVSITTGQKVCGVVFKTTELIIIEFVKPVILCGFAVVHCARSLARSPVVV